MSEPTTPDSHPRKSTFHESDIEFLRASAREWLEAVLGENLDRQTSLEDLLADGTLLYRASQHIREDPKFPGHEESPKASAASPSFERKSSLKFQPYASVETFLNMCKAVGLRDVDVFNPSDVVDQKDIRRVCVCLRRLSKKARSMHLLVPDFDNVADTLVTPASQMSREAVQKTKESLQKSANLSSPQGKENGPRSSQARLRKEGSAETKIPGRGRANLAESFNKVQHDGRKHSGSDTSSDTAEGPSALKPTMSKIMLKAPSDKNADEKAKASAESQKGLFRAHLEGTAPYSSNKEGKDGGGPWLLLGVLAFTGGILGLVVWTKGGDVVPKGGLKRLIKRGKKTLRRFRSRADDSSSSSDSSSDSDNEVQVGGDYNVKEGDNLTKIAKRSGKKNWREIVSENPNIGNPNLIHPGDRLKL